MLQRLQNMVKSLRPNKNNQGILHDSMFSPFEKQLGLDNQLRNVQKKVQVQQRVDQFKFGLPLSFLIIGFLVYILTKDEDGAKIFRYKYRIKKAQILSSLSSAKWLRSYLLKCYNDYYNNTNEHIPKCYIKNMYSIMREDRLEEHQLALFNDTMIKLSKAMTVYEPSIPALKWVRQVLYDGLVNEKYGRLDYNRDIAQVAWKYGDLEQQYLALLVRPDLTTSPQFLKRFQLNLNKLAEIVSIDDDAYFFKNQVLRKQALYIMERMGSRLEGVELSGQIIDRLLMSSTAKSLL